ncbi:hypothetical protein GEMRC1_011962 [Eukaryota sp. GEM-RC1]
MTTTPLTKQIPYSSSSISDSAVYTSSPTGALSNSIPVTFTSLSSRYIQLSHYSIHFPQSLWVLINSHLLSCLYKSLCEQEPGVQDTLTCVLSDFYETVSSISHFPLKSIHLGVRLFYRTTTISLECEDLPLLPSTILPQLQSLSLESFDSYDTSPTSFSYLITRIRGWSGRLLDFDYLTISSRLYLPNLETNFH